MAEPNSPDPDIHARLHDLAQALRFAEHLEPEAQKSLADLLEELGQSLKPAPAPAAEADHLLSSVALLAERLQEQHNPTLLAAAKNRVQGALLRAETQAPLASGVARRLLDALADLGI